MKKVILLVVIILGSINTVSAQNVYTQTEDLPVPYSQKKSLTPSDLKNRGFIVPLYSEIDFDSKTVIGQIIERYNGNNWILACPADKAKNGQTLNYDYLDVSELYNDTIYRVTFTQLNGKKYIIFFKPKGQK